MLRELSFSVGDKVTIQELHITRRKQKQLTQSMAFNFVDFTPIIKESEVDIL